MAVSASASSSSSVSSSLASYSSSSSPHSSWLWRMTTDAASFWFTVVLDLFLLATPIVDHHHELTIELCDTEVFRAECADHEVILLTKAWYGRMRLGRCVEMELGYVGCHRDLLLLADQRCSGKRVCEIRIPDAQFENTRPCLKELKNYMEVSYTCIPVETVSSEYCRRHNELNVSSASHGFIANIVTTDTPSCDGTTHPWVIRAGPGQRINLTLYDFALATGQTYGKHPSHRFHPPQQPNSSSLSASSLSSFHEIHLEVCRQYGLLQDGHVDRPSTICGGKDLRISRLHLSKSNLVKVWLTAGSAPRDLKRFVIEYRVIGCADFPLPPHFWFERTSDGHGILGCEYSDDRWRLRCHNNTWFGSYGNCSFYRQPEMEKPISGSQTPRASYDGVVISVIVGISIGIAVLIIVVGVVRCVRN